MLNWYLACHQPGKDSLYKAQMQLSRLHIDSFCPQIRTYRSRSDTKAKRMIIEPLFSGYIFVQLDPEVTHTTKITAISSISHFVKFGSDIRPVPDTVVESLMNLPQCPKEKDYLTGRYKDRIMAITRASNKHERSVMFLAFIKSTQTSSQ